MCVNLSFWLVVGWCPVYCPWFPNSGGWTPPGSCLRCLIRWRQASLSWAREASTLKSPKSLLMLCIHLFLCPPRGVGPSISKSAWIFLGHASEGILSTCPNHRSLLNCRRLGMSSMPRSCLNSAIDLLSLSLTEQIHLTMALSLRTSRATSSVFAGQVSDA